MENYKYSIGNVFLLRNLLNVVVYISKEELFCLTNNVNSDGEIFSNWAVTKYDLTKKVELEKLAFLGNNILPTTKFGEVGSLMVYGVNDYLFLGVVNRTLGTFTFKKPLLLELNKIVSPLQTEIEDGNNDLDLIVAQLWDSCIKIPFESDKNISLTLLQEPQLPIRNFTIVEVESVIIPKNNNNMDSSQILLPLNNTSFKGFRSYNNRVQYNSNLRNNIIIGVRFNSNMLNMVDSTSLMFNVIGKKNQGSDFAEKTMLYIDGLVRYTDTSSASYTFTGKEEIFPDWKLDMDNEFLCGDSYDNRGYTILGKVLFLEQGRENTKFGKLKTTVGSVVDNKKYATQFMLWHPQIFQGYNVDFSNYSTDNFLMLKNDLVGSRKGISYDLTYKSIGSPTYPIKTRAFLKKQNVTKIQQTIGDNLFMYTNDELKFSSSTTFFPLSYKPYIDEYEKTNIRKFEIGDWDKNEQMSWEKFRLISSNNIANRNVNDSNFLQFFDYGNLNNIQNTNPILFEKLVLLINKATNLYDNLLPVVSKKSSNLDIVEYVGLDMYYYAINRRENAGINPTLAQSSNRPEYRTSNSSMIARPLTIVGSANHESEIKDFFLDPIFGYLKSAMSFFKESDNYTLNGVHIKLSLLQEFIKLLEEKYAFICEGLLETKKYDLIDIDFRLRIFAFSSNYFPFQELFNSNNDCDLVPNVRIELYVFERTYKYYDYYLSIDKVTTIRVQTTELTEDIQNAIQIRFTKLMILSQRKYRLFMRFRRWKDLIQLFTYYEVVKNEVREIGLKDVHNDLRFKYFLRDSHIFGFFTEKDIDEFVMYFAEVNNIMSEIQSIANVDDYKIRCTFDLSFYPDLDAMEISEASLLNEFPNNIYSKRNDIHLKTQFVLLKPEAYGESIREIMDMMKEDEVVGRLLTGETTPSEEWYRIFGGGMATTTIQDEDGIVELEDDFDFDSLDLDLENIEVDLSEDEILEDNIDI